MWFKSHLMPIWDLRSICFYAHTYLFIYLFFLKNNTFVFVKIFQLFLQILHLQFTILQLYVHVCRITQMVDPQIKCVKKIYRAHIFRTLQHTMSENLFSHCCLLNSLFCSPLFLFVLLYLIFTFHLCPSLASCCFWKGIISH